MKRNSARLLGSLLLAALSGCAQQHIQQSALAIAEPPPVKSPEPSAAAGPVAKQNVIAQEVATPADSCKEPHDIWVCIRNGFVLPDKEKPGVEPDQLWFSRHPEYLNRVSERATPYIHYIVESLEERGMPSELALLPVVESAYQLAGHLLVWWIGKWDPRPAESLEWCHPVGRVFRPAGFLWLCSLGSYEAQLLYDWAEIGTPVEIRW